VIAPAKSGSVHLVGAGPGSLDLLTLRAHALICSADCILHDDLVSQDVLVVVKPAATIRNVGKRCGIKAITQQQINQWMVESALAGQCVVRLKSGDPLLFGRAAEEIEALQSAGIPFEIVPGVSSAFAAAAAAAIPLTGRVTNSQLLFVTRHLAAGNKTGLTGIKPGVTLIVYMPGRDYWAIQTELLSNGWPPLTRCLIASSLASAVQQLVSVDLQQLHSQEPLPSPSLMLFLAPEKTSAPGS
jgi:uroporphyrin-III C-methyltransferase